VVGLFYVKEGSIAFWLSVQAKRAFFRWPFLRELARPRYPYIVQPSLLAWLCQAIEETRKTSNGCIVEVGVARGMTTVFLLEHMRVQSDTRPYICVDTFAGFIPSHIEFEVSRRGKATPSHYGGWAYNDQGVFESNLRKCGYLNWRTLKADAAEFDWSTLPPIDVMFIDLDIYVPTKAVLERAWPYFSASARILVDDCRHSHVYDGAGEAYREFCRERGIQVITVGTNGGAIIRSNEPEKP
jgi:hypothetical protein